MDIVTLLKELVNGLIKAEEDFYQDPVDLHKLEVTTKATTDAVAAKFISSVLSSMNEQIYKSSIREEHYIAQRTDSRTLISSEGDLVFDCTYYKRKNKEGYVYLLEEMLKLGKHERFTEKAEEMILAETLKTSYAEAAIDLVRYSREKQRGLRTGTDDEVIKKISVREVTAEHYDQARSYIDRLQASIPGLTAKKSASIRTQLNML